ncbi:PIN domain-containing protein [Mycobacterium sp. GA-1841]|uniref:PIN domain-containing protein n=1 Tax=Mycobacterium sp. GA-1841 TaxID=1834154 RepID=UPI001C376F95|nr:PIN domain-containing protein [Mycobacterium sp. GA-1841]
MTYFYLDSSVAVRILLGHSMPAAAWFDTATGDPETSVISSRLLRTELTRVLRREGLPVQRRDALLDYVGMLPISDALLAEAEAIVPHIKTLDAIHLASVIRSGLDATVVSHDATMLSVAGELGYATLDPCR